METIGKKLLGYNRRQVEEHLARVREIRENEIKLIRENIEACRQERESLKGELESLQEERERRLKSQGLYKCALERVKKTVDLINQAGIEDIKSINEQLAQKVIAQENSLSNVEKEIRQARSHMDAMLQSILQISREKEPAAAADEEIPVRKVVGTIFSPHSKSEIVSAMGEDILGKTVVSSNGSLVGKVGNLAVDHATGEVKGFYLKGGNFISPDCVMAVKKDSLVVSTDWQKAGQKADKASLERLENLKNLLEKQLSQDDPASPEDLAIIPQSKDEGHPVSDGILSPDFGGFWGDGPEGQAWPGAVIEERAPAAEEKAPFPEGSVPAVEHRESFFGPAATGNAPDRGGPEASALDRDHLEPGPAERRESPVVAREIKTVRHKYVVGKLAGEDLLDGDGGLIVRKNEMITPGIIDRAEREGKLAELIINMVIPGLEQ